MLHKKNPSTPTVIIHYGEKIFRPIWRRCRIGSQISTYIKSKHEDEVETDVGKDSLFCLGSGQIEQPNPLLLQEMMSSTKGWPNLQCQGLVSSIALILQELRVVTREKEVSLKRASETGVGKLSGKLLCNV